MTWRGLDGVDRRERHVRIAGNMVNNCFKICARDDSVYATWRYACISR